MAQIINFITLALLLLCSYFDIRTRQIPLGVLLIFGSMIAVISCISGSLFESSIFMRIIPGAALLLLARLTGQAVGYGDGVILLLLGIMLDFYRCIFLIFIGLLLCSLAGIVGLVLKKAKRHTELPFMPFLLTAWGILLIGKY